MRGGRVYGRAEQVQEASSGRERERKEGKGREVTAELSRS